MQQFLEKAKQILKKLRNFAFSKKGFTLALALILLYNYHTYPQEVYSNGFLTLLNENKVRSIVTLDKTMVLFKVHGEKTTFMTHYLIENIDHFNKFLLDKKVLFRNLSEYFAFFANPKTKLKLWMFTFSFHATLMAKEYFVDKSDIYNRIDQRES